MKYGITFSVDGYERTEHCEGNICLKDSVNHLGLEGAVAGMIGLSKEDIDKASEVGNCAKCKLSKFLKNKEQ